MKRSDYTLLIEEFPAAGKHLFYCTRTKATVVIDGELKGAIAELPAGPGEGRFQQPLAALAGMGFLVEDEAADAAAMEDYFRALRQDRSRLQATVLTTYACNFACPYCVEEGVKGPISMDLDTARAAVAYILRQAEALKPQSLFVSFYGGEPLMNLPALRLAARELYLRCRERGLPFAYGITTNGALLTPRLVEELRAWGLKGVKVTIDGSREQHDRRRPFKSGRGSFDLILQNVAAAAQKIDVDVGGNFDGENVGSFPELLDTLGALGLADKLHAVRFTPISETLKGREGLPAHAELACVYAEPATARHMVSLRRLALDRGFRTDPGVGVNVCSLLSGSAVFAIDPLGRLYKCPALVGHDRFQVGDIWSGENGPPPRDGLWRRCLGCPYLPLCGDGCQYGAYLRFGDPYRLNCQKDYVEQVVRENLKTNYRQHSQARGQNA